MSTGAIPFNANIDLGSANKIVNALDPTSAQDGATKNYADSKLRMADAGGSANAITATFTPATTLTDKMYVIVIAASANTTTTPTFAPDGLTAHTIVQGGGQALRAGDIQPNMPLILEYNLANTRWELLNPNKVSLATDLSSARLPYANVPLGTAIVLDHTLSETIIAAGSASETIAYSYNIGANEVISGDVWAITLWTENTSSANNKTWRIYVNTSNSLSGATLIGTSIVTTSEGVSTISRTFFMRSDTSAFTGVDGTIDSPGGSGGTTLPAAKTVPSVSAGFWVIASAQKASAGETVKVEYVVVTKTKYS